LVVRGNRPVYLEILPATHIARTAINAKTNGDFSINVFSENVNELQTIETQVQELNGKEIGKPFSLIANKESVFRKHFENFETWNPEQLNLYNVIISIKQNGKVIHCITQRFGFRTAELRPLDGFYVNAFPVK